MRLRDLLLDYCEIDGLRIVSVLNLKMFFPISKSADISHNHIISYIANRDVENLRKSTYIDKPAHSMTIKEALELGKRFGRAPYFINKERIPADTPIVTYLREHEIIEFKEKTLSVEMVYKKTWLFLAAADWLLRDKMDILIRKSQEVIQNTHEQSNSQSNAVVLEWFKKYSSKENPVVLVNLGMLYADGRGVTRDDVQAVSLYEQAANEGDVIAMGLLSSMYKEGRGVERSPQKAAYW